MVWLEVAFWLLVAGFFVFLVGVPAWRLGELYGRSGVGWWKRVARSEDVMRCRVCGAEHAVERHDRATDSCGHLSCVQLVMLGRKQMAEARDVGGVHLAPKLVQGKRADGSLMFTSDGEPVMVRDPSGDWEQVPGPGGTPAQRSQDAVAKSWKPDGRRG